MLIITECKIFGEIYIFEPSYTTLKGLISWNNPVVFNNKITQEKNNTFHALGGETGGKKIYICPKKADSFSLFLKSIKMQCKTDNKAICSEQYMIWKYNIKKEDIAMMS